MLRIVADRAIMWRCARIRVRCGGRIRLAHWHHRMCITTMMRIMRVLRWSMLFAAVVVWCRIWGSMTDGHESILMLLLCM